MIPGKRFRIFLLVLSLTLFLSLALTISGISIYSESNPTLQKSSVLSAQQSSAALFDTLEASLITVLLNILVFFGGSLVIGHIGSFSVFKEQFKEGVIIVLLIVALDNAGFRVSQLDYAFTPGLKVIYLISFAILGYSVLRGYLRSRDRGMTKRDTERQSSGIRERIREGKKPMSAESKLFLTYLLLIQSILPTVVTLIPFTVASGLILGTVPLVGFFYLWGPGSLAMGIWASAYQGWLRTLAYLSMATIGITMLGGALGVAFATFMVVPNFQPYLLLAATIVMLIAYANAPGIAIPRNVLNEIPEELERGNLEVYLRNFLEGKVTVLWLYLLLAPSLLIFASFLSLASSIWGLLFGVVFLISFISLLYDLPQAWVGFCISHGLV